MVNMVVDGCDWMVVGEEGAVIKRISLKNEKHEGEESIIKKLTIPCDKNFKIILDIQPFKNYEAMLSIR